MYQRPYSNKNNPLTLALALQSSGRNCYTAPDSVLCRLLVPREFSGGVFFHRHPLVVHYIVLAATTNARRTRKNACVTVRSVNTSGPLCQDIFLKIRLHRTLGNKDRDQLRATLEQPFSSTYIYIYIYICIHIICIYIHRYIPLVL